MMRIFTLTLPLLLVLIQRTVAFVGVQPRGWALAPPTTSSLVAPSAATTTSLFFFGSSAQQQQMSEAVARKYIDKVVAALRKDSQAKSELGNLNKVQNILGYGCPTPGTINLRFNASFQKGGGIFAKRDGNRGTMVGQVKATVDIDTGKVTSCSVFRDLGYGRSFNLKC